MAGVGTGFFLLEPEISDIRDSMRGPGLWVLQGTGSSS